MDRDDVVGALDAFVDGGEHVVDLGEVNGRVFVNNVSMGLYAEAVQSKGYRNAKIRTLLDTVPAVFGPSGSELDLQWVSPDGTVHPSAATILVSNNPYRLGHAVGSGTRPRIDAGTLGVAVVPARAATATGGTARPAPFSSSGRPRTSRSTRRGRCRWVSTARRCARPARAIPDTPRTLRVRISPRHPGASPSAMQPDHVVDGLGALVAIASGRLPIGEQAAS